MWKHFIKDYFTFTRKERAAIITILGIIVLFLILPYFFPYFVKTETTDQQAFERELGRLKVIRPGFFQNEDFISSKIESPASVPVVFYFDPNRTSAEDWKRLGVREKTIATIQNYIQKGGSFRKPDDLRKIYGLSSETANRLIPMVRIKERKTNSNNYLTKYDYPRQDESLKKSYDVPKYRKKEIAPVDINSNDSAAFMALPGIGPVYTGRIMNYRSRLGGFNSIDQVAETYLLPDSVFQNIKKWLFIQKSPLRKININTADFQELNHPYISKRVAQIIIQYRKQHGRYNQVEDLNKIMVISEELLQKITPYLRVE